MFHAFLTLFVSFGMFAEGFVGAGVMGQQRGTLAEPPEIDLMGPPPTFKQMWNETPLVIHGRIVRRGEPQLGPADMVVRHHAVRVLEVLKPSGDVSPGSVIQIEQLGGALDVGGREVRTSYPLPLLDRDNEAIFFLKRENTGQYIIWFGKAGLFRISPTDGLVDIPLAVQRMAPFVGATRLPLPDVIRKVRQSR